MKKILLLIFMVFSVVGFAQDSFALSSESELTIEGTSTVHTWVVKANTLSGVLKTKQGSPVAIDFEVMVAEIKSERGPTMDNKMHAALKKEEHPKVSFLLEEVKDKAVLVGVLSIAGAEKQIEISAAINTDENVVRVKGEKNITLQDFDIEPPTAMFGQIIVGDVVTVKFDLLFNKEE